MIKIENTQVYGFEAAIRGMRNPMNSWEKSDSYHEDDAFVLGKNDLALMKSLVKAGSDHSKFMRMINVTMDITAPLYWWKEFDTYKVGTVRNSCSTMHKIADKKFDITDFSYEHLRDRSLFLLREVIQELNLWREIYNNGYPPESGCEAIEPEKKEVWWQMIQLLPSSYNQRATIQLNYAVLRNMYKSRKDHKLDEWHTFCNWIENLPYGKELIFNA